MTNFLPSHNSSFVSPIHEFQNGYSPHTKLAMGVEAEFFVTSHTGAIAAPSLCDTLCSSLNAHGFGSAQEFAGIVEICGAPFEQSGNSLNLASLTRSSQAAYQTLAANADMHGYMLADTSHLALLTEAQAINAMAPRPRALAGFSSMQRHSPRDCRLLPLLNAGTQLSLNVRNDDELYEHLKLAYPLMPMLYAVLANHPAQFEGLDCTMAHPRGRQYDAYGKAGGVSQAFLQATRPQDLVAGHCRELADTPLFFTYDAQDNPVVPEQQLETFSSLPAAQRTADHFRLAQSFNYHDIKICNIHNAQGQVSGKRIELRPADAGYDNMLALPVMMGIALRNTTAREQVKGLLADYGFKGEPVNYADLLLEARNNAVYHAGKYMRVAFGKLATGQAGEMAVFARDFLAIVGEHARNEGTDVRDALVPIIQHVRTRQNKAEILALSA